MLVLEARRPDVRRSLGVPRAQQGVKGAQHTAQGRAADTHFIRSASVRDSWTKKRESLT